MLRHLFAIFLASNSFSSSWQCMDDGCARCKSLVSLSDWRSARASGILPRPSTEMSRIKKQQRLRRRKLQLKPHVKPPKPLLKRPTLSLWESDAVAVLSGWTMLKCAKCQMIKNIPPRRNRTVLKIPGYSDSQTLKQLLLNTPPLCQTKQCFSLIPIQYSFVS